MDMAIIRPGTDMRTTRLTSPWEPREVRVLPASVEPGKAIELAAPRFPIADADLRSAGDRCAGRLATRLASQAAGPRFWIKRSIYPLAAAVRPQFRQPAGRASALAFVLTRRGHV
jgi:hypothetical protein